MLAYRCMLTFLLPKKFIIDLNDFLTLRNFRLVIEKHARKKFPIIPLITRLNLNTYPDGGEEMDSQPIYLIKENEFFYIDNTQTDGISHFLGDILNPEFLMNINYTCHMVSVYDMVFERALDDEGGLFRTILEFQENNVN